MKNKCRICGRTTEDDYTVVIIHEGAEIGTHNACGRCLESNHLVTSNSENFQKEFEETFGNSYIGSDFI